MGEVGSGKTVVALYAMLRAVEHGAQAALMAPTETLAEQHFATCRRCSAASRRRCALLTGSTPGRAPRGAARARLPAASCSLIVGTHALIEPDVALRSLGGGGGRRAAPLRRRASARRCDRQGAGGPHRRMCCT